MRLNGKDGPIIAAKRTDAYAETYLETRSILH